MYQRQTDAQDKAAPYCRLCDLLAEQTIHERSQECACQCAPGIGHQRGDRGVLVERQQNGDHQEYGDQHTHDKHFLFVRAFFHIGLDEVDGQRGAGSQYQ